MGGAALRPDMDHESKELQLEDGLLEQLQDKYCCRVKVSRSSSSPPLREGPGLLKDPPL